MLETNKTTVQIMRKLKAAGYRLYYLTNIPTDVMDELRQREWFSLFDGGIASCDVHLCKPEPEIFTTLMQTCPAKQPQKGLYTKKREKNLRPV